METVEHEDGRTVWACYDCGQSTEYTEEEHNFLIESDCLCPDCEEWHKADEEGRTLD